jgi:hypothetical protein
MHVNWARVVGHTTQANKSMPFLLVSAPPKLLVVAAEHLSPFIFDDFLFLS